MNKSPLADVPGVEVVLSPPLLAYFLAVLAVWDRDGRVTQRAVVRQMGKRGMGPTNVALRKLRDLGFVRYVSGQKGGGTFLPCFRVEFFRPPRLSPVSPSEAIPSLDGLDDQESAEAK